MIVDVMVGLKEAVQVTLGLTVLDGVVDIVAVGVLVRLGVGVAVFVVLGVSDGE